MRFSGAPAASVSRQETTPFPSDSARPVKESAAICLAFVTLTAAAAAMACLLALLPAAGHDQMWFLYMAGRVLHGTHLYGPQLFDSNPPLIVWLSAVPTALAAWLHLPSTAVAKLLVVGIEAAVATICLMQLKALRPTLSRTALWALAFAYVVVFAIMPARDFGQRDHLLAVLCLPYLLAAAMAVEGIPLARWKAVSIGIAAGIGLSLKPHQLLVPIGVEAIVLWKGYTRHRSKELRFLSCLRPELLTLCLTCAAYLAAIRILTPDYLTQVLTILRDTYWAIGSLGPSALLLQAIQLHVLAVITLALQFVPRPASLQSTPRTLATILIAAGIASTIAYYLQGTGWYYQQIPALSFFALAAWIELLDLASQLNLSLPRWTPWAAAGLSALALALTAYFSGYSLAQPLTFPSGLAADPDPSFFAALPPGTPVAILTTEVDLSVPPIFLHHLLFAQRMNNLWTLPAILRNETPTPGPGGPVAPKRRIPLARLAELDHMQHAWMVEDLNRWHPQLILIERCQDPAVRCQVLEDRHDDLLAWFLRDPAFRATFAQYHFLRSSGPFDAYVPN